MAAPATVDAEEPDGGENLAFEGELEADADRRVRDHAPSLAQVMGEEELRDPGLRAGNAAEVVSGARCIGMERPGQLAHLVSRPPVVRRLRPQAFGGKVEAGARPDRM